MSKQVNAKTNDTPVTGGAGGGNYSTDSAPPEKSSGSRASQSRPCRIGAKRASFDGATRPAPDQPGTVSALLYALSACAEARTEARAQKWPTVAEAVEACDRVDWLGWFLAREAYELGPRVALAWLSFLRSQTLSLAIGRANFLALTAEERWDLKTCMTVELIERGRLLSNLRGGPRAPSLADVLELQKLANDHRFSDRESRPELVAAIEAASMLMQATRLLLAGEPDGPRFADACALAVQATERRLSTAGPHTSAEGLRRWRRAIPEAWRIEIGRTLDTPAERLLSRDRDLAGAVLLGEVCASNPIGGAS